MYNITSFNYGQEVVVSVEETPIVIENEPQIIPDQLPQESITTGEQVPIEAVSGETAVVSGTPETSGEIFPSVSEAFSGELAIGETLIGESSTGETLIGESSTGETLIGESSTGETLISGDATFFSGVLEALSGEVLYNISGDVVGEILIQSGDVVPVDLSGDSLIIQELSTIYPTQEIQVDGSGFIKLDSLESVITTGGEVGVTYCSRIAYDNISNILKAGVWTWRETNDYLAQGDTDRLIQQGLIDYTLLALTGDQITKIFSGNAATVYGSVYDVYIDFTVDGQKVYHRITVIYGDDEQRYVLDPLRGAKTIAPQKISDYLGYYNDEADVHRYIGQAYSPLEIKKEFTRYDNIAQLFQQTDRQGILSGEIFTGEITTGEVVTGEQTISTGILETGNILPVEEITTGTVPEVIQEAVVETPAVVEQPVVTEVPSATQDTPTEILTPGEEIVTGYFDTAYDKGAYSEKIIELQKILNWMNFYTNIFDGVYSDLVIESIYQYQLSKNILTPQDPVGLRGYLGPSTRRALNASYVDYQLYEIDQKKLQQEQHISSGTISTTGSISPNTGTSDVIIPVSGQQTLETIGTLSGVNIVVLFDPLTNPLLFSGLFQNTGYQELLSGYTTGQIMLEFSTGTKKDIIRYLRELGYQTGNISLVRLSDSETLVGDVKMDFSQLTGAFLVPVVLQSTNDLSGEIAEVQIPEGAMLKTSDGEQFTGELLPPVFLDPATIEENINQEVLSVIDVGNQDQHIQFEDMSGNSLYATFRMPAPGMNAGDTIDVNYSENGIDRIYLDSVEVQMIDGDPYAIFEANHFTTFYLGNTTGTFTINNDATYATGLAVTLTSNVSGATQMRFGNTIAERDAASWTGYQTGFSWNLTGTDGIQRVYAQFSGGGYVRGVSDSIILDMSSGSIASGLQLQLDGTTGATTFLDIGPRNLPFTIAGTAYKQAWSGEDVMYFNGTNGYASNTSGFITAYPFTISARVKPANVIGTKTIMMFGNSTTNSTYYGIRLVNANAVAIGSNTTARSAISTVAMSANTWYHVVGVFASSTSRTIYVDAANPVTNTATATFSATSPRRRVGRRPGSTTTNYFSGNIDEVRVYNKALSATEISGLFMDVPTFNPLTTSTGTPTLYGDYTPKTYLPGTTLVISGYTIATTGDGPGRWKTVPFTTGLAAGTYTVTMNYMNVYGKTGSVSYTSGLIIASSGATIIYNPSSPTTGNVVSTLTGLDATYMIVNNFGSEFYTFTGNGSFIYQFVDKVGTTGSITATVDRIKLSWLNFSTTGRFENISSNNGTMSGNITITLLGTGSFSGAVANYTTINNLPAGLTGVVVLSGTNTVIVSLTGSAINNYASDSTGNVSIVFATGAFIDINPSDVVDSTKTGLSITFYDPAGFIPGEQLRVNGFLSGGQFYDRSPNHRTTTNYGATVAIRNSSESVMSFDGNNQYAQIGTYTLTDYTISARFYASVVDGTRRSVFGDTAGNREMSLNTSNNLELYNNGSLISSVTIQPNTWYHAVVVKDGVGTKLYINGVLDNSNASTTTLSNVTLDIGDHEFYSQPWSGYIDEVKIYDSALSQTQVESLYMNKPNYTQHTVQVASPNLDGLVSDHQMSISLIISGMTYPAVNNQDGTRTAYAVGPFTSGTYDVQLNYTNIYGRTGMAYYTGGLTVYPIVHIDYSPGSTTSGNVIATVTGYDMGTIITNNGGSPVYTFTGNGQFSFDLQDSGMNTYTVTAIVDRIQKASVDYSSSLFYEDSGINNGSIANTIIATITGDTFSSTVISSGLIQMTNVPAGLTGSYALSGTDKVIIGLTGNATNHLSADNINNVVITFLTGAFATYPQNTVGGYTKTGIAINFVDGSAGTGMLRLDGSYSGTQFYDLASSRLTTGYNAIANSSRSGETVMGLFNGTNQYIDIGTYTLPNYSISAWFKSTAAGTYRTIVGGTTFEMSRNPSNYLTFYDISLTSTNTLATGIWYHVVRVQNASGTKMYINGVLDVSNSSTYTLSSTALAVGRWSTSQYRSGNIDEVHVFDSPLSAGQVKDLYLKQPEYINKTVFTGDVTLTGIVNDTKMYSISVVVSGTEYASTIQGDSRTVTGITLDNGTYDVQLDYMNVYGATGSVMYTGGLVVAFDTIPPTATITYSTTGATSGDVFAIITGFSETVTGLNATGYLFTGNGSFEFTYQDFAGNTGSTTATVTRIDKIAPTATIDYSITGRTNQDVVATLTGFSESVIITNNGGSGMYLFTGNGSFEFTFSDLAGNTGSMTAVVTGIDKIQPTFTGVVTGAMYVAAIEISFDDSNLSGATLSGFGESNYYSGDLHTGLILLPDGDYTLTVYDLAGNSTGATFQVDSSVFGFSGITSGGVYSGVIITYTFTGTPSCRMSGVILSGLDNSYYSGDYSSGRTEKTREFNQEGVYMFIMYEADGDTDSAVFTIDSTTPTLTGVMSGGYYTGVTIDFSDVNLSGAILSGLNNSYYSGSFSTGVFTGPDGRYSLMVYDKAGHSTGVIFTLDTVLPIFTGVMSGGVYYTGITIDFSDANLSGVILSGINGNDYYSGDFAPGTLLTQDGEFILTIYDLASNSTGATFDMDTSFLYFSGIVDGGIYSGVTITYGLNTFDSGCAISGAIVSGLNNSYYSGDFQSGGNITGEGIYTFTVYENDGDFVTATFTIDRSAPILTGVMSGGYYTGLTIDFSDANLSGAILSGLNSSYYSGSFSTGAFTGPDGRYLLTVYDKAENLTSAIFTIDTTPPTFTGIATGGYYNTHPQIFFSDENLSGAILSGTNNPYYSGNFSNGGIGGEDGRFAFRVYDLAGNRTGANYRTHTSILHFSGVATGGYYNTGVTIDYWMSNEDPDCAISGAILSGLNGNPYYDSHFIGDFSGSFFATGEGTYSFMFYEVDGDRTGAIFTIDYTPPTTTAVYDPAYSFNGTTQAVTATLTGFSEPVTILNNDGTGVLTFTENGDYTIEFQDLAGNHGSYKVHVYRIKPNLGTITGASLNTIYTSNVQTIQGWNTGLESVITVDVSNSSGTLYKNDQAVSGFTITGMRDDMFYLTLMSSPDPLDLVTSTMTISNLTGESTGVFTGVFSITTMDISATIGAPTSFDFGTRNASDIIQTITKTFSGLSDYFRLVDRQGLDTGYYTTISISDMTTASGDIIPYTSIAVKALDNIVTLSGTDNPRIYSAITGVYQYFTASPLTFISRDTAANGGVMGTYGLHTIWKIDVPAMQNIGDYTGVITYTLY